MPGALEDIGIDRLIKKKFDFDGLILIVPDSKVWGDVNFLLVIWIWSKSFAKLYILHARKMVSAVCIVFMAKANSIPVAFLTINLIWIKRVEGMLCAADGTISEAYSFMLLNGFKYLMENISVDICDEVYYHNARVGEGFLP